ncbi:hypothetical protein AYI70_g275 [Smittium culicis]|uniref:pH-response regulator protein palC n=2 Tax=Smittium culicis TaxID=133412 RepID=A0A1R1YHN0_9FUNG|nr:hypothetical protein AYI70_g275 [Smittium culicis]
MRLPCSKAVSLLDLIKAVPQSGQNSEATDNIFLEKLLDITRLRENMRTLLKEQDNITDYAQASSLVEAISSYLTELQTLKTAVETNKSFTFSEQVVFIWTSSLLENKISGATSFVTKKIRDAAKSDLLAGASSQLAGNKLARPSTKNLKSLTRKDSFSTLKTDLEAELDDLGSPTLLQQTDDLKIKKTKRSLMISAFTQRSSQSPSLDFELANVLLVLGISKVFKSYTQFNNFEFYLDSEFDNSMLPTDSLKGKASNGIDPKSLASIKNIFPFNRSKKDAKSISTKNDALNKSSIEFNFADYEKMLSKVVLELRESAGIFNYILKNISPRIQLTDIGSSDLSPNILLILQKLSLADADRLVAGKAVALGYKPGIVARMLLYVSEQYSNVLTLSKNIRLDAIQQLNNEFRSSIKRRREFVFSLALIYLSKDCYEKNSFGLSVTYIKESLSILTKLSNKSSDLSRDCSIQSALAYCNNIFNLYTKNNDTFGFEPVPSYESIRSKIPTGRPFNEIAPFNPNNTQNVFF